MKKIYIIPLVVLAWFSFSIMEVISHETQKADSLGETGAPGEGVCTDCHSGRQINSGQGIVTFTLGTNGDNRYFNDALGVDNAIDLTITISGKRKFGFETTALDKNNKAVGHFWAPNNLVDSGFKMIGGKPRYYGYQDGANGAVFANAGGGQWRLMWQCPLNYTDPVHFYTAYNETNEDGTTDGDCIYTRHDTAFPDPTVVIAMAKKNPASFNAFVTANHKIQVAFEPTTTLNVMVDLYNMDGQKVQNLMNKELKPGAMEQTVDMPANMAAGIYLISCETNGTRFVKKVFIN